MTDPAIREQVFSSEEFEKGRNDAFSLVGTLYQRVPDDDPDPLIQEAKTLAKKIAKEEAIVIGDFDD